ncbi:MAG: putative Mg(2+) transport ATPase [Parcubacteria group bacterium]|nr:putative Mg(2+) transport ATPase [Parcubacteria group bacterium]
MHPYFTSLETHFAIALILSLIIGYIMGVERELRGKDAGVSTHILVIIGAMLFAVVSSTDITSPTRIAAQVVTGIGFLGAGLILRDGTSVKNLTTASSLWVAAGIGIAFGFGFYLIGFATGIMATLVARIPRVGMRKAAEAADKA